MRVIAYSLAVTSLFALAACEPSVPDSGAGVLDPFAVERPAPGTTITGDPLVPAARISTEPLPSGTRSTTAATGFTTSTSVPAPARAATNSQATNSDLARETAAALSAANRNSGVAPLEASPSNPAPQLIGNPSISDENDFEAVSSRHSIESDAARIARNKEQFQQVVPTALPQRDGGADPNIVRYALGTSHPVGTRVHSRAGLNLRARSQRNCAVYQSPDEAQIDFLRNGGPQRDRKTLDPDGDGYACGWDPRPLRQAVTNR